MTTIVSWDPDYDLATFVGPGGFTQVKMSGATAKAVATALGVKYEEKRVIVRV